MAASALAQQLHTLSQPVDSVGVRDQVKAYLDTAFPDLGALGRKGDAGATDFVKGHKKQWSTISTSSARSGRSTPAPLLLKRSLEDELAHWVAEEATATKRLGMANAALPSAVADARAALADIQGRAQTATIERFRLVDDVATLISELDSSAPRPDAAADDDDDDDPWAEAADKDSAVAAGPTLLEKLEGLQASLARTEAALAWSRVLERILALRAQVLDPANHRPSALAALPHYRELAAGVAAAESTLPPGMALLGALRSARDETWATLKNLMGETLLAAAEPLGWPKRVDYAAATAVQRRAFERAYTELLLLQAEGEHLNPHSLRPPSWSHGDGLYPLQMLVKPITLRFKYHFQGTRNTNRVDKPEWAFASVQDTLFAQEGFVADYLQPLTARAGYASVDVKAELTMLLFPTLLGFLRTRIPHLLTHPALLAHTVYQTVLFDDAVRENGFRLAATSLYRGVEAPEWEGLTGVVLREKDWFEQWLAGEKKFAETSLNEIISSPTAWNIADATDPDDDGDDDDDDDGGYNSVPATESARQVRSLIEQITDRYAPLPAHHFQVAFLRQIQLPTLKAYHSRVSGSLDAFETLSSAFVRVVPGALGAHPTGDSRLSGVSGLERLLKAHLSADYILAALRAWADDVLFAEISADIAATLAPGEAPSVWDPTTERYATLRARSEDMMVRLVTAEVEGDLKEHLTRRWDVGVAGADAPAGTDEGDVAGLDASLVTALTSYTALVTLLMRTLPHVSAARLYRRVSSHLVNHIAQRAVYSGWSKFTAAGGRALAAEVDDWRHAAAAAVAAAQARHHRLGGRVPPVAADAPWAKLAEMAAVLSLPSEADAAGSGTPTFAQAMAAAWGGGTALESLRERAGIEQLSPDELQAVLRRRVECWR